MSIFRKLFGKKNDIVFSNEELLEMNVCPNCWGRQEYQDQFIEKYKDETKSNMNDKTRRKAFILQFVETNITGIKLTKADGKLVCHTCNTKYKN